MKKIVFIGDYRFPSNFAACNRVFYMAKACQQIGYDTLVIGKGTLKDTTKDINDYRGVAYTTMEKRKVKPFVKLLTFFKRRKLYSEALTRFASDATYVIAYGCSCAKHMKRILRFGEQNNIEIVCDISEWYDRRQFFGLRGSIEYAIFDHAFKNTFEKADKIICCSKLVRNYFIQKKKHVLILNGILDTHEFFPCDHLEQRKCALIYAGIPSTKDCLIEFYEALDRLEQPEKVELSIVGPTEEYMEQLFEDLGYEGPRPSNIKIVPRVDKKTLIGMIKNSSFSVLLRPNKRYANAGFPSKLCESLSVGTPMVTNLTSDIGDYLSEKNSVIIKDISVDSVVDAIRRAMGVDQKTYDHMRRECIDIAEENFSIEAGAKRLEVFLKYDRSRG